MHEVAKEITHLTSLCIHHTVITDCSKIKVKKNKHSGPSLIWTH